MEKISRREFLLNGSIVAGVALGGLSMGGELISPSKALGTEIIFPESSCQNKKSIKKKILIAYASFCGSTGGVAEAIGRSLCDQGAQVDIRFVKNIMDISSYEGVILGSPVRSASWLPGAIEFVQKNQERLRGIPVAYFLTCLTLYRDTPESRRLAKSYMNPVLESVPSVHPIDLGLFAGVLDYSKMNIIYRTIMKSKMKKQEVPAGDFRDWKAIQAWTQGLGSLLLDSRV